MNEGGEAAVASRVPFTLAAPRSLVGLPEGVERPLALYFGAALPAAAIAFRIRSVSRRSPSRKSRSP